MDWYRPFNRYAVQPLYYWRQGSPLFSRLKQLQVNQYLSPVALAELQSRRLHTVLNYAYTNTTYYRELFDQIGFNPAAGIVPDILARIPPLTKATLQTRQSDLISDAIPPELLVEDASGGSTGRPTTIFRDQYSHFTRPADQLRHDQWCGWRVGERYGLIWGAARDLHSTSSVRERTVQRFINRVWELNAFDLDEAQMYAFTLRLHRARPSMILGYSQALVLYANYLRENFPEYYIHPKGVISSAERLTGEMRQSIEQVFGCRVFNRYGSREVGLIASECNRHNGLHINADNLIVEIVNNGSPVAAGVSGDILITDLGNLGMPLIRYQLGDVGTLATHSCTCGRNFPLLQSVDGRHADFFTTSAGRRIHGEYFTHLFYGIEQIHQFQLIQETIDRVVLKLVVDDARASGSVVGEICAKIRTALGPDTQISVEYCTKIPPSASGKFLFTLSKVN